MPETSEESIFSNGSKSFSLAAKFFPKEKWKSVVRIYHWCRHCDDAVDEKDSSISIEELRAEVGRIWDSVPQSRPFLSMQIAVREHQIPKHYIDEMINGMEMDLTVNRYETIKELEIYCYRVASTVGLIMCHVMGLFHQRALENAAHLGIAMQLTNIARDVNHDFTIGRIYLPREILEKHNIPSEKMMNLENRTHLYKAVLTLIEHSEKYYESGLRGLRDLPLRSAFVILLAANLYREIGREILRIGPKSLTERTVVGNFRKCFIFLKTCMQFPFMRLRYLNSQNFIEIKRVWSLNELPHRN